MPRLLVLALLSISTTLFAQGAARPQVIVVPQPTPEERAFARLPADIQQMLAGQSPAQALQSVQQANQHLIALGVPYPSPEQFRMTLRSLLRGSAYSSVDSASAGATTFPPLSPLVAPPLPPLAR